MKPPSLKEFLAKAKPADNVKLAEMEMKVERGLAVVQNDRQLTILSEIQQLIERIKLDDVKIRQLEDMKGITWKGKKTGHEDG